MRKISVLMSGLFVSVLVFAMAGCGGGSDSGGAGGNANYTGNTAQATITANNAKAVSADAMDGVQAASALGALGKSTADTSVGTPVPAIAEVLEKCIIRIHPGSAVSKSVAASVQDTVPGYTGSFSYSINVNESSGAFSGSLSFSSFRENSLSEPISGSVAFSGSVNTQTEEFVSFNMSFSALQAGSGSASVTLNGSMAITNGVTSETLDMSIVLIDKTTNRTFWMEDFKLVLTGNKVSVSGTYYDYANGYVVISTVTPLTVTSFSDTPLSGQLLFTGSNGTKARLTYTLAGYLVEVDTSGNNTYILVP